MPEVDYSQREVAAEWDVIWSAKNVADEAKNIDRHSVFFKIVDRVLNNIPSRSLVIEAGCGLGRWLLYCGNKHLLIGLDYSFSALIALKAYQANACVSSCDVFHLPMPSNIVDCCLSFGVLEHFEGGPSEGISEAKRVLKPGGILLISGPGNLPMSLAKPLLKMSRWNLVRRIFRKPIFERGNYFFQYRFSPGEMERFLTGSGFRIIETIPWGNMEIMWQFLPFLRHRETKMYRCYHDVVMSGTSFRLTPWGVRLHTLVRQFAPWMFQYAWIIQAVKPMNENDNEG